MIQMYAIANKYYEDFEQFRGKVKYSDPLLWGSALFGIAFIASLISFFYIGLSEAVIQLYKMPSFYFLILCECAFLFCFEALKDKRNRIVYKQLNKQLEGCDPKTINIHNIKRQWLKKHLPVNETEFLDLADNFSKALDLRFKTRKELEFNLDRFFNWIYCIEAKPRILTLIVILVSAVAALSFKDSNGLISLMEFYASTGSAELMFAWILSAVFLGAGLFGISISFRFTYMLLSYISKTIDGRNAKNRRTVNKLIRDLVEYHRLERIKI